jgi:hypothetical protein
MAKRQSTGKRLRFEVFQRDRFTCQYCGAQPPDVLLVVDHITAVSRGGGDTLDNLITACEPCNQGKADRELGQVAPRPDADLLYLSTQQEIAEIRRYQQALRAREAAVTEAVQALQDAWLEQSGLDWCPADAMVRQLINRHGIEVADRAMGDVALKLGSGYLSRNSQRWVGYLHTVARNMVSDEAE